MRWLAPILVFLLSSAPPVCADDIFRIEIGKERGSNEAELQRRVWALERAVWQLQQRVFNLEASGVGGGNHQPTDSWLCTIEAMGDRFTGTGGSRAVAIERAVQNCKAGRGGDGFFCKDAKCSNQ